MQVFVLKNSRCQISVEVVCRICKCGKDNDLFVPAIDRAFNLLVEVALEVLQFCILCGGNLFHLCEQRINYSKVAVQVMLPRGHIHIG